MEDQNQTIQQKKELGVEVSGLINISKWTRFISIFGFVIGAFVVMSMLVSGAEVMKALVNALPIKAEGLYGAMIVVFFIFFFIAAAILYFLYKASQLLSQGAAQKNSTLIAEGFVHLKRFFIILAIFGALSLIANLSNLFA